MIFHVARQHHESCAAKYSASRVITSRGINTVARPAIERRSSRYTIGCGRDEENSREQLKGKRSRACRYLAIRTRGLLNSTDFHRIYKSIIYIFFSLFPSSAINIFCISFFVPLYSVLCFFFSLSFFNNYLLQTCETFNFEWFRNLYSG